MDRVVIIGGGVLGLMHAVAARRRGLEVVHLEREADARGASVRDFGLIWVGGRAAGPELALALRARTLWEELAAEVPGAGVVLVTGPGGRGMTCSPATAEETFTPRADHGSSR
jgi:glycine/D-amino acid oxidase-like deaminating enzyme